MAIAIPSKEEIFDNDDIRIGEAEIKSRTVKGIVHWELPGNEITHSKAYATEYAERMNQMIQVNKKRFNRSLLWS